MDKFSNRCLKHIQEDGCDDVIKAPFFRDRPEIGLIGNDKIDQFLGTQLGQALNQNPVSVSPIQRIAVPKGRYTFRDITQIALPDTLKYSALVFSIADKIEEHRRPRSIVFSNRYKKRGSKILDRGGFDDFKKKSKELSDGGKYTVKIVTDIANFYDRLNIHKLESILKQIKCDPVIIKKIEQVLIHWSGQQSYGLPVGSDASRLLAEAMLINVDKSLSAKKIKYIRYVDDFRIFCASHSKAYEAMQILTASLSLEGLFVNSGKTRIVDLAEGDEEEDPETPRSEFEPIDPNLKVEATRVISSRYSSRIAKYYRSPGKEAIKKLQKVVLEDEFEVIKDPQIDEVHLKNFIKAVIYAEYPDFKWLEEICNLFPHLIPYISDAIEKEYKSDSTRFDAKFFQSARAFCKEKFRDFRENDYFRIQLIRCLRSLEGDDSKFLSAEILRIDSRKEILMQQFIYIAGDQIERVSLLKLIESIGSYGANVRFAIIWALKNLNVIEGGERDAILRNLKKAENDAFVLEYIKF